MALFQASLPLILVIEHTQLVTTKLANLERVRASYIAQLNGEKETRLSPQTLRDDIHRVECRIADLRHQLTA